MSLLTKFLYQLSARSVPLVTNSMTVATGSKCSVGLACRVFRCRPGVFRVGAPAGGSLESQATVRHPRCGEATFFFFQKPWRGPVALIFGVSFEPKIDNMNAQLALRRCELFFPFCPPTVFLESKNKYQEMSFRGFRNGENCQTSLLCWTPSSPPSPLLPPWPVLFHRLNPFWRFAEVHVHIFGSIANTCDSDS